MLRSQNHEQREQIQQHAQSPLHSSSRRLALTPDCNTDVGELKEAAAATLAAASSFALEMALEVVTERLDSLRASAA
jgi:hypothetical protein